MKFSFTNPMALVATIFLIFLRCALAQVPVNTDDLDPLKECKRRDVAVVESNNKVYIYGGQSWVKNGTEKPFPVLNHYLRIVDFTKARDLSDSSILSAKDIDEQVTIFRNGAFWSDSNKLYVVGGAVVASPYLSEQGDWVETSWGEFRGGTIFTYDIDGDKWSSESAVQPDSGASVREAFCCGSFGWNAQQRKAYYYSGSNWAGARQTDPESPTYAVAINSEDVTGNGNLLGFDTPGFKWSNNTADNQLANTWTEGGQLVYLPGTETSSGGIAIVLGGQGKKPDNMVSLRQVLVYDARTGSWYSQQTTADGDKYPTNRMGFCAVAASAPDNSSHNVYVYAGESPDATPDAYSDMYILSIPSFHWIAVDVNSEARKSVACTRVADRYMVTYGGIKGGWEDGGDDDDCDTDNYGLRLFDLTSLEWTSKYEGPASGGNAYTVPSAVYKAIGGDEKGSATRTAPSKGFDTPAVGSLFGNSQSTSTSLPDPSPKKSNTAAIAGGVVGGLAGLAIILVGILWFLRQKKRKAKYGPAATSEPYEAHGTAMYPGELPANGPEGNKDTYEIYGRQDVPPQELDAGGHYAPPQYNEAHGR